MNKYFSEDSVLKHESLNPDMKMLAALNNEEIELMFMNKLVRQHHRPFIQEFKVSQEFIFSGCSETQGHYICEEEDSNKMYKNIWGFSVAKSLSLDSINLGIGGESIYRIVQRLFSHFKSYENPKNLMCLFPDPFRLTLPKQENFLISRRPYAGNFLQNTHHDYPTISNDIKYVKKPFFKEDVIAPSVPAFLNFQAILNLEQYCEQAGIKFLWGSWHQDTNMIAKTINSSNSSYYKNFVDLTPNDYDVKDIDCHRDLYIESPNIYSSGSDDWHLGTHGHTHIADKFFKEYTRRF
jgi:hypothetical protein